MEKLRVTIQKLVLSMALATIVLGSALAADELTSLDGKCIQRTVAEFDRDYLAAIGTDNDMKKEAYRQNMAWDELRR